LPASINMTESTGDALTGEVSLRDNMKKKRLNIAMLTQLLREEYGFAPPVSCSLHRPGMSDVYKVVAGETFYLKVYRPNIYDKRDYEEEAFITHSLNERGIRTAAPVPRLDGGFVMTLPLEVTRYAVLYREAVNAPSGDEVARFFILGQATAKMHAIADEQAYKISRPPIDFDYLVTKPLEVIRQVMRGKKRKEKFEHFSKAMHELRDYIAKRLTTEPPLFGFCHGDVHPSNVFFDGDEPVFFDFDTMGCGWRAHDIGALVTNACGYIQAPVENKDLLEFRDSETGKAFFEGYNAVRRLTEREMECIDAFAIMRLLWALAINLDRRYRPPLQDLLRGKKAVIMLLFLPLRKNMLMHILGGAFNRQYDKWKSARKSSAG